MDTVKTGEVTPPMMMFTLLAIPTQAPSQDVVAAVVFYVFVAALMLLGSLFVTIVSGTILSTRKRFRQAQVTLTEDWKTLTGVIRESWFGTEKAEEKDAVTGLVGLINSIVNSRLDKYGFVSSDVAWLSARRKKLREGLSEETCWRLLRLFKLSSVIYAEPCRAYLDTMNEAHNHPSLTCKDEKGTATISEEEYERGRQQISSLSSKTNNLLAGIYTLKITRRGLQMCVGMITAALFGLSLQRIFSIHGAWPLATFAIFVIGVIFVGVLGYPLVVYGVRRTVRVTTWPTERMMTGTISGVVAATLIAGGLYSAIVNLPSDFVPLLQLALAAIWNSLLDRFLLLVTITAVTVIVFRDAIAFILQRSKGIQFDESFVDVIQKLGTAYALIMFSAVFILGYQHELGIASPEAVVWIYAFIMSLLTGFLGYAARGSLDDFFSGVMLRVDRPFSEGDRIELPSGEICDVTKMGMTMVTLYNVTLNAEIYIPNKKIADMTITNISRPDLELRIQLSVPISAEIGFLEQAEEIMIDCAYAEGEVDQALVTGADLSEKGKEYWNNHDRVTIEEQIRTLTHDYPDPGENASPSRRQCETRHQDIKAGGR